MTDPIAPTPAAPPMPAETPGAPSQPEIPAEVPSEAPVSPPPADPGDWRPHDRRLLGTRQGGERLVEHDAGEGDEVQSFDGFGEPPAAAFTVEPF